MLCSKLATQTFRHFVAGICGPICFGTVRSRTVETEYIAELRAEIRAGRPRKAYEYLN